MTAGPHPGFLPAQTCVLVGAASRSGSSWMRGLPDSVRSDYAEFRQVQGGAWGRAVHAARAAGAKCVAVAGGDGTLRRAAPVVAGLDMVMGVVPTGTGNAFATDLGLPSEPREALAALARPGEIRRVDLGDCGEQPFVSSVTLGVTSFLSQELRAQPKGVVGKWAYLPALLRAFERARPFRLTVRSSEHEFDGQAIQCVLTVTRLHGGPFRATPGSAHDDGLVSAYVVEAADRAALLVYGAALLAGRHTALPSVWSAEAQAFEVAPAMPRTFVLDGDRFSMARATVSARPGALAVFVPTP